ncbi:hypothetical protein Bca52824_003206 [Brassica carinata]|uniref:Uncharacterized protein n=1 Tax=Brassica carinata TaxID=52824 RepID=A0A8X7WKP0_BRACI|nr:hypothetical protein Bca52824_003206 [Brassica carinata]
MRLLTKEIKSNLEREKQLVVVLRSSRISNASSSSSSLLIDFSLGVSKGRNLSNQIYVSEEIRENAFSKAEKLQADLGNRFPSFVKSLLQSHVSGGFWLV